MKRHPKKGRGKGKGKEKGFILKGNPKNRKGKGIHNEREPLERKWAKTGKGISHKRRS